MLARDTVKIVPSVVHNVDVSFVALGFLETKTYSFLTANTFLILILILLKMNNVSNLKQCTLLSNNDS